MRMQPTIWTCHTIIILLMKSDEYHILATIFNCCKLNLNYIKIENKQSLRTSVQNIFKVNKTHNATTLIPSINYTLIWNVKYVFIYVYSMIDQTFTEVFTPFAIDIIIYPNNNTLYVRMCFKVFFFFHFPNWPLRPIHQKPT